MKRQARVQTIDSDECLQVPDLDQAQHCFGSGAAASGDGEPEDLAEQVAALEELLAAVAAKASAEASADEADQVQTSSSCLGRACCLYATVCKTYGKLPKAAHCQCCEWLRTPGPGDLRPL